jgi:glycosyltransferase involved in cell wall biosynthesis
MLNDRVIAVSEYTRRYHKLFNSVRDKHIHVVHNFVDSKSFLNISAEARLRIRQALGFDNSSLLIGSVGQISEKKGTTYLVRAMKQVFAEVPEARLMLVGNGSNDYISRIVSKAEKLGIATRIVLAGPRFDIPELLAGLDLFASASLRENFALSIIEAMAAGLPIVATAVGGAPECVRDGENGILAPPGKSEALANAIIPLLRDAELRNKMGQAGRNRALEEFSPEAKIPMIEEVLWRAAGSGADIAPAALQNQFSRPLTGGSSRQD